MFYFFEILLWLMLLGVGLAASDKFVGFISPLYELRRRNSSGPGLKARTSDLCLLSRLASPSFILSEARSYYVAQPNLTSK